MKLYFFETSLENRNGQDENVLRALPNQYFENGEPIDISINVQSPNNEKYTYKNRINYPIGTIFCADHLEWDPTHSFYSVFDLSKDNSLDNTEILFFPIYDNNNKVIPTLAQDFNIKEYNLYQEANNPNLTNDSNLTLIPNINNIRQPIFNKAKTRILRNKKSIPCNMQNINRDLNLLKETNFFCKNTIYTENKTKELYNLLEELYNYYNLSFEHIIKYLYHQPQYEDIVDVLQKLKNENADIFDIFYDNRYLDPREIKCQYIYYYINHLNPAYKIENWNGINYPSDYWYNNDYNIENTLYCFHYLYHNINLQDNHKLITDYKTMELTMSILNDLDIEIEKENSYKIQPNVEWENDNSLIDNNIETEHKIEVEEIAQENQTTQTLTPIQEMLNKYPVPNGENNFYVAENKWKRFLAHIYNKHNILLTGPTGCGKTEMIKMFCKQAGLNFTFFTMGGISDAVEQLIGKIGINKDGTKFHYSEFALAIQKQGIILLDEINRAPMSAKNLIFNCLDGLKTLKIVGGEETDTTEIQVHPNCIFVATANIGTEYSDTKQIDNALKTRFKTLELDYLPIQQEKELLIKLTNIDENSAFNIAFIATQLRELAKKGDISNTISVRDTIGMAELIATGLEPLEVIEETLMDIYDKGEGDDDPSSEFAQVKMIIMQRFEV